jgi:hypothetical protein
VKTKTATLDNDRYFIDGRKKTARGLLTTSALVFFLSFLMLFLGVSRSLNLYDEGLVLTGAMRVAAGQIPHRDFYANYGPAEFYIPAGLFKLFGESILVENLYDLCLRALLLASVWAIARSHCSRWVAIGTLIVAALYLVGLNGTVGSTITPVSLLNLMGAALILPIFLGKVSRGRMCGAGAIGGVAALFRYDTGVALLGIYVCLTAVAVYLGSGGISEKLRNFASIFWPCLVGFALVTVPPALYYLSVAPIHPFVHDIILYPSKYYHRGRNLPFPGIDRRGLDNLAVYLPIAAIIIAVYAAVDLHLRSRSKASMRVQAIPCEQNWSGLLVTFGLLAFVMYFKGFVRVSPLQMFLSTIPSLLLIAMLYQHRLTFARPARIAIVLMVWLSFLAAGASAGKGALRRLDQARPGSRQGVKIISSPLSHRLPEVETTWCKLPGPLTRGMCFLPDDDRIRAIEFIDSHTLPNQKLYVGVTKHDRIYGNDNLIYFATQRLPATRWSHFDPFLQNRLDIQKQMVDELTANAPPYIVIDPVFDQVNEPNGSSTSTGVTLLDDYIHNNYRKVQTFGEISIWQRILGS